MLGRGSGSLLKGALLQFEQTVLGRQATWARSVTTRPGQKGQLRNMRSSEVLMDRLQPAVYEDVDNLMVLGRGWRAKKRFRIGNYIKTARALAYAKKNDSSFSSSEFGQTAEALFQEFHNSLALGQLQSLYDVAIEPLSDSYRAKPIPYASLVGTPKLTQVTSFLEKPTMMQARLVQSDQSQSDIVFVQLTVKFLTEARIVQQADFKNEIKDKKRSQLLATRINRATGSTPAPARYLVAFDSKGGEYYWNTSTMHTTWKRPPNFLLSRTFSQTENGTLGVSGRTIHEDKGTGMVQQEHIVVFERPMFNLKTPWRICFF